MEINDIIITINKGVLALKKFLCMMLALSILVSMTSGLVLVSADDSASTLNTIFSFDFNDDNYTEYSNYYMTYTGNSSSGGTQQTDSTTYGIDGYDRRTSGLYIPLGTETDADEKIIGVKRTGVNNLYIEAEFDYMILPFVATNASYGAGGVALLTYSNTGTLPGEAFGSLYHGYTSGDTATFYRTVNTTAIPAVTPDTDKWYRCKIVCRLTDDTGALPANTAVYIYIDGVKVANYTYKTATQALTDEYVRFLRLHLSNGQRCVQDIRLAISVFQSVI